MTAGVLASPSGARVRPSGVDRTRRLSPGVGGREPPGLETNETSGQVTENTDVTAVNFGPADELPRHVETGGVDWRAAFDADDGPASRGGHSGPPLFAPVPLTRWEYQRAIAAALHDLAARTRAAARGAPGGEFARRALGLGPREFELARQTADRWSRIDVRATALARCGTRCVYDACTGCGAPRERSGRADHSDWERCQSRSCAACQKARGARVQKRARAALDALPASEGSQWFLLTFTARRDHASASQLSVSGLRYRVRGFLRGASLVWRRYLRKFCDVCISHVEIAGTGNVHMHALVRARGDARRDGTHGPAWFHKGRIEELGRKALPEWGHCDVKRLGAELSDDAVREALKYVTKAANPDDQGWSLDETRPCLHPALAARWELATWGARLLVCRGLPKIEEDGADDEESDDGDDSDAAGCACHECGSCDGWREQRGATETVMRRAASFGRVLMRTGSWKNGPDSAPHPSEMSWEQWRVFARAARSRWGPWRRQRGSA